ncbi:MAG: permease [Endomicrobiia bacterium]
MIVQFLHHLRHYTFEIVPALIVGFLISGIVQEFVSTKWVEKHLGGKGIKPILYSTIIGTVVPVCCWGSLPIAVTFFMKGASLGPVLSFLIATPATSINALLVVWRFFGIKFAVYIFFSVILTAMSAGFIGNKLRYKPNIKSHPNTCPHCQDEQLSTSVQKKTVFDRIKSILKFAYIDLPREIGLETAIGLVLAAVVSTFTPIGMLIQRFLYGIYGYLFSVIFGLIMYMCATMSVPLVHALVNQGLNIGAGFALLLIGPITSYGTILVIRKEFGFKILLVYLSIVCISSVVLGYIYSLL